MGARPRVVGDAQSRWRGAEGKERPCRNHQAVVNCSGSGHTERGSNPGSTTVQLYEPGEVVSVL